MADKLRGSMGTLLDCTCVVNLLHPLPKCLLGLVQETINLTKYTDVS